MNHYLLVLKVLTLPLWLPLWLPYHLVNKTGRLLVLLALGAVLAGCASSSNTFDKSPCACSFEQINTGNYGAKSYA
jgi:hypothetical protein